MKLSCFTSFNQNNFVHRFPIDSTKKVYFSGCGDWYCTKYCTSLLHVPASSITFGKWTCNKQILFSWELNMWREVFLWSNIPIRYQTYFHIMLKDFVNLHKLYPFMPWKSIYEICKYSLFEWVLIFSSSDIDS